MNTAPEPSVRVLEVAEAPMYAAFRRDMLAESPLAFASDPASDPACEPGELARRLAQPGQSVSAVFVGSTMAAAAGLFREPKLKMNHRATLWGVWTRPEHRGRGHAERAIRHALDVARSWGVSVLCLSANRTQASAIRLYTRLGFRAWGIEPNGLRLDGVMYDEVHMQLALDGGSPRP